MTQTQIGAGRLMARAATLIFAAPFGLLAFMDVAHAGPIMAAITATVSWWALGAGASAVAAPIIGQLVAGAVMATASVGLSPGISSRSRAPAEEESE
jgi:hypothetical protein